jgi:hypothetical protein
VVSMWPARILPWIIVMTTMALALACGEASPPRRPPLSLYPDVLGEPLVEILPEDPDCQDRQPQVTLGYEKVWQWQAGETRSQGVSFRELSSSPDLASPAFGRILWGGHYLRQCEPDDGEGCVDKSTGNGRSFWLNGDREKPFRICESGREWSRRALESVALAAARGMELAWMAARRSMGEREIEAVSKVDLWMMPTFETVRKGVIGADRKRSNVHGFIANNLAYLPEEGASRASVVVFPETLSWNFQSAAHLWESAFVVAHEYGHHIFRSLAPRKSGSGYSAHVQSVAEGFADLAGWYANGASSHSIEGMACLSINRDPSRGVFGDGTAKTLDARVWEKASDGTKGLLVGSCDTPDFRDPHAFGSVLAHQWDRLWTAAARWAMGENVPGPMTVDRRYALLMDFARAWERSARRSPKEAMAEALHETLRGVVSDAPNAPPEALYRVICPLWRQGLSSLTPPAECRRE